MAGLSKFGRADEDLDNARRVFLGDPSESGDWANDPRSWSGGVVPSRGTIIDRVFGTNPPSYVVRELPATSHPFTPPPARSTNVFGGASSFGLPSFDLGFPDLWWLLWLAIAVLLLLLLK